MHLRRVPADAGGLAGFGQGLGGRDERGQRLTVQLEAKLDHPAVIGARGDPGFATGGIEADVLGAQAGPAAGGTGADELGRQHVRGADEIGDEAACRAAVDLFGGADLLDRAVGEDRDAVSHRQCLFLVMGDEDEGHAKGALQPAQFLLHLLAQLQVKRAERFVKEQHARLVDERPGKRHTLPLAARKGPRTAVAIAREFHQLERLLGGAVALGPAHALHPQPEGHVVAHVHVREERIVLEHGVDVAPIGRHALGALAIDLDMAGGRLLEARDQAQTSGLAGTRGPQHGEELAIGDVEVNTVDGPDDAEMPTDAAETHSLGHAWSFREEVRKGGPGVCARAQGGSAAHHGDVVGHPAVIGHAAAGLAFRGGGAPEPDLVEVLQPVRVAALGGLHTRLVGAGLGHRGHGAEPDRQIRLQVRVQRMLHEEIGAGRVLGFRVQHQRVGPARGAFLRHDRADRRAVGLQQVDLERPGGRGDDALVLEVVDLHHRVVPVARDQLTLALQEFKRRGILVLVQLVGVLDAEFGLVRLQIHRRIGNVDRAVIGLHPALVRLAVGQRLLVEHDIPAVGRGLEHLGVVHQHVRPPHEGHAVMGAVDGVPGRILQPVVDALPVGDQIDVDRLHLAARDQPQRGIARGGDQIEAPLVHQRHHFIGGARGLHLDLAAGGLLELGDPVIGRIGLAALDIARPGDDRQRPLGLAQFLQHLGLCRQRQRCTKGDPRGAEVQKLFHQSVPCCRGAHWGPSHGSVSEMARFRKFNCQKPAIGKVDIIIYRCTEWLCAARMNSRAVSGRGAPLRQTTPTCTTGSLPETSRETIRSPSSDQRR
ncbi:hypothetical protein SDC9_39143 [bioreactor metagenome]|uniref:Uncharacterized protein n=1 Tax=bioreactor metagenome TaxID=1076179 RepID=A0A644VNN3_9ZZZZ